MRSAQGLRLPGVYFLPPPRAVGPQLPPLDVAAFVGFAARGPLDTPVAIEDQRTYAAIFGGDLPLARDAAGRTVYANLAPAVASFFANGGRRCYAVRVAGPVARTTRFVLPGMLAYDDNGTMRQASISAAWPGRWSADLRLGTRLQITPLPASKFQVNGSGQLVWQTDSAPQALRQGDVLRLRFDASGPQWLFPVRSATRGTAATPLVTFAAQQIWQLSEVIAASPPLEVLGIDRLTANGPDTLSLNGVLEMDASRIRLTYAGMRADEVQRGDTLQIGLSDGTTLLFPVSDLRPAIVATSPPTPGQAWASAVLLPSLSLPQGSPLKIERLRFDMLLHQGSQRLAPINDLAFNLGHPRFWGIIALAESSVLQRQACAQNDGKRAPQPIRAQQRGGTFQESDSDASSTRAAQAAAIYRELQQPTRSAPARDGVRDGPALAGLLAPLDEAAATLTYLPLDMLTVPGNDDLVGALDIGNDDLGQFGAQPFLDEYLVPFPLNQATPAQTLLTDALDRYYIQDQRLYGLHSLLFVDEVALIAVPDAVHRPWNQAERIEPPPPVPAPVASPPESCPPDDTPFKRCEQPPTVASITPSAGPLQGGTTVRLSGENIALDSLPTVLFGGRPAQAIQSISDELTCVTPVGRTMGLVDVTVSNAHGSATLPDAFSYQTQSTLPELPVLIALEDAGLNANTVLDLPSGYDPSDALLPIQQALINICQARRDALAVLVLPAHFEKRQCIDWQQRLRQLLGLPSRRVVYDDAGLSADLSYAAVYHPWVLQADAQSPDLVRAVPCDGTACGMIAARERQRQVWVAPANLPLVDVLGLTPMFSNDDWAELFDQQFNLVRPEPQDFRAMSAHTLADDQALLQISVRRLMILLRKAALERGAELVFESNSEQFRVGVRATLNAMLRFMFERGAFAGATVEDSYQVVTDASVNTPQRSDQGQFIAEIQVRPSQPVEFLTVLLMRSDEGQVIASEV